MWGSAQGNRAVDWSDPSPVQQSLPFGPPCISAETLPQLSSHRTAHRRSDPQNLAVELDSCTLVMAACARTSWPRRLSVGPAGPRSTDLGEPRAGFGGKPGTGSLAYTRSVADLTRAHRSRWPGCERPDDDRRSRADGYPRLHEVHPFESLGRIAGVGPERGAGDAGCIATPPLTRTVYRST
jgi:hypothetical protein